MLSLLINSNQLLKLLLQDLMFLGILKHFLLDMLNNLIAVFFQSANCKFQLGKDIELNMKYPSGNSSQQCKVLELMFQSYNSFQLYMEFMKMLELLMKMFLLDILCLVKSQLVNILLQHRLLMVLQMCHLLVNNNQLVSPQLVLYLQFHFSIFQVNMLYNQSTQIPSKHRCMFQQCMELE